MVLYHALQYYWLPPSCLYKLPHGDEAPPKKTISLTMEEENEPGNGVVVTKESTGYKYQLSFYEKVVVESVSLLFEIWKVICQFICHRAWRYWTVYKIISIQGYLLLLYKVPKKSNSNIQSIWTYNGCLENNQRHASDLVNCSLLCLVVICHSERLCMSKRQAKTTFWNKIVIL